MDKTSLLARVRRRASASALARIDLDAEPPDAAWMEDEALRRREAWERERPQAAIAEAARRAAMPYSERIAELEQQLALVSHTGSSLGGGSGGRSGKPDGREPPPADENALGHYHPAELPRVMRLLEEAVSRLEAIVDSHRHPGLARPQAIGVELDKLLREKYAGFTPEEVSRIEPTLGSPAAVRKSRANMNLHRETGEPLPPRLRKARP